MAMMRWDDMTWDQKYAWYDVNQPKPWNPKSARAIRFKSCNRAPDSQLTKGYVKQAKKDKRQFGGLSLREMQKAAHKLMRRENQREIASGLLDHELEVQEQKLVIWDDLIDLRNPCCEIPLPGNDLCQFVYVPPIRWVYKHEGD